MSAKGSGDLVDLPAARAVVPLLACVLLLSLFDAVDATAPSGALLRLREGFREAASDAD